MIRRETTALPVANYSLSRQLARRSSRSILVRVLDGHREVDSFQVARAETLRAALRPLYRQVTRGRETVQFLGLEEETLALGIKRTRSPMALANLAEALIFLGS